jgi:DNA-binding NtrC family response regulator
MSRVLIVDDEKNVLMTLSMGLKRHDFDVHQAQSGPAALEILKKEAVDFVVSDVRMHPMDGMTLARQIHASHPEVGIVLMSAYGFEGARSMQGFHQLTKPFDVSTLVKILNERNRAKTKEEPAKGILLVCGEYHACEAVQSVLDQLGFEVHVLDSAQNFRDQNQETAYDLFLIDESFLEGDQWKILNEIDLYAPFKPVVILAKGGRCSPVETRDLSIAMMDKDRFFQNPAWAGEYLAGRIE